MEDTKRATRERVNQDRRKEVVSVAARLFAERGFHGTSMDDIARELGILKGSLYYWIESKEALLGEVLEGSISQTIDEATEIAGRDIPAAERLRLMVRSHIDSWIRNPNNFNVFIFEWRWLDPERMARYHEERDSLEETYKRVLSDGISSGEFGAQSRDISILVNGIFGTMNWFPRWYREGGWASPEHIAEVFAGMIVNGLRAAARA